MSSSARKKEKHRLKRKEKKQQIQRMNSRTPLQRIAAEGGELECWITPDWKEQGIASIQVLGRASGGRGAFAAFLVDLWAVGLKDAFGRSDVPWLDFREGNMEPWLEKTGAVKLDPALARRLVAGGVRFGGQNGFRMPPQWEKYAVIFGRDILDQVPTADVSDFGIDGGLRYVGTMDFLRTRLAVPPEEFLARPDVRLVMGEDPRLIQSEDQQTGEGDTLDVETMEKILGTTKAAAARMAEQVRQWIAAHNAEPIPKLDKAAKLIMISLVPVAGSVAAGEEVSDEELESSHELVKLMLASQSPQEAQEIAAAVEKVREILAQIYAEHPEHERLQAGQPGNLKEALPDTETVNQVP